MNSQMVEQTKLGIKHITDGNYWKVPSIWLENMIICYRNYGITRYKVICLSVFDYFVGWRLKD